MSSLNLQITRSWNKWFRFGTGSILGLPRSRRCDAQQVTPHHHARKIFYRDFFRTLEAEG